MYSDRRKKKNAWLAGVLILLVLLALFSSAFGSLAGDVSEEGAAAIREAVRRSALQCYVVEGVYPPGLSYLEENYGLQINTEDYYVVYDCFASNLPPTVRVVRHSA